MKITIYELLGLIKDGKAPKKIVYNNRVWKYEEQLKDYYNDMWSLLENQIDVIARYLNDEVQVIEEVEEDEFEDIERLGNNFTFEDNNSELSTRDWEKSVISKKINSLIKNQKKIIRQLKNK